MRRKQKLPFNSLRPYIYVIICMLQVTMQVGDDVKMLPRRQYRIVRYNNIKL